MGTSNAVTTDASWTQIVHWRRLRFVLILATLPALPIGLSWDSGLPAALYRTWSMGLVGMVIFGLLERWPRRLPRWLARWVLQVISVALAMPITVFVIYVASTPDSAPAFWTEERRLSGFFMLSVFGLLLAPWGALCALVRQRESIVQEQALRFELERSELERQALDAQLRLMQGQVSPHFLFNTLANVQSLVEDESPKARDVLRSLIAYLRAAVPRLEQTSTTLEQELELVRSYLEVMQMRMSDRLAFTLDMDEATKPLACPPTTVLTLIENAIRHGIDPSEQGGHIFVTVRLREHRCRIVVRDTGLGLASATPGLGTGLKSLRSRLRLAFDDTVRLRIQECEPRGVEVELEFPAQVAAI